MSQLKVNSIVPTGGLSTGAFGGIIQVIPAFTNATTINTTNTFADITGLSVTITPSSTSSKFLIMTCMTLGGSEAGTGIYLNLVRNSTPSAQNLSSSSHPATTILGFGAPSNTYSYSYFHLDETSLSDLSDITYKYQIRGNAVGQVTVNQRSIANDLYSTANLIVCEVSG